MCHGAFLQRAPLHLDVSLDVVVCSVETNVAEPRSNDGEVDAALEQPHRGCVSKGMGRNGSLCERAASAGGDPRCPAHNMGDAVSCEAMAPGIDEYRHRVTRAQTPFIAEPVKHGGGAFIEGNDTLLGALASEKHLMGMIKAKVLPVDSNCLRYPCPSTTEEEEQRVVPLTERSAAIGSGEDRVQFRLAQIIHKTADRSFPTDTPHALNDGVSPPSSLGPLSTGRTGPRGSVPEGSPLGVTLDSFSLLSHSPVVFFTHDELLGANRTACLPALP